MTNKRPLIADHSSPAFSPAFSPPPTPASATYSPKTSTHLALGRRKSKASAKRRKSANLKTRDGDGGSRENELAGTSTLAEAGDEDDEAEQEDEEGGRNDDDYTIRKREDLANKDKLRELLNRFDPQQMDRYTEYRTSGLAKTNVRKLANSVLQQSVSERVTIVIRGLAKVFVGEMVEQALEVQRRRGGSGPITPFDLREAYRAHLAERDRGGSDRRKMFCR
ncbi:hypothetical protein CROQUDRAFT_655883 [Cronartium quercuum f. sp. fusiforme G11]|uniref:TAFII28-like protein domain-containing protein n=1 Tax=Cronartium quercuum f. sp. fusiforme G11 TaxID=708437 RepID=A0A9P6NKI9_9BASI|nr:hypothetical protein CROQUDRAFT_655883 [Cronartium quercuum f. sp. fusiforme G11]